MVKTFSVLFFVLTILNGPLFLVYYYNISGDKSEVLFDFDQMYSQFTMRNLGETYLDSSVADLR